MTAGNHATTDEEEIWALENEYFSSLYRADYDGVLSLLDSRFLGWPDGRDTPVDYNMSARFMRNLVTSPVPCTLVIDRKGIRISGDTALTQYTLNVTWSSIDGTPVGKSSAITHTWIREGGRWRLLGGMSRDLPVPE
ncbi:MAG: nuclear transport factor 2 family protein [Methanolinea sp.]